MADQPLRNGMQKWLINALWGVAVSFAGMCIGGFFYLASADDKVKESVEAVRIESVNEGEKREKRLVKQLDGLKQDQKEMRKEQKQFVAEYRHDQKSQQVVNTKILVALEKLDKK